MKKYKVALIFGSGAFGTSMASILAENFERVIVKVRSKDIYESMNKGENSVYLPGQKLASNIIPALEWSEVEEKIGIDTVELMVNGLPTGAITPFYSENKERIINYLKQQIPFMSISKGIDAETLDLSDDLLSKFFASFQDQSLIYPALHLQKRLLISK